VEAPGVRAAQALQLARLFVFLDARTTLVLAPRAAPGCPDDGGIGQQQVLSIERAGDLERADR
jgi:hypothetical protein